MSVVTRDYEEGFEPETEKGLITEDPDKTEVKAKEEEHNKFKDALKEVKENASKRITKAANVKKNLEEIRNKVNDKVDQLTATALGGLCGLIGLPNDFIDKLLEKDLEVDGMEARCEEEIASNEAHIAQYKYDISILDANIKDYVRKEARNKKVDELAEKENPKIPKELRDYPYYLDKSVYEKWKSDMEKYDKVLKQLEQENKDLTKKKSTLRKDVIEGAKNTAVGRKIKDSINTLKTSGTQIIKGVQLLIQNIVALFTEGIGAAVVAMGSGVVVSPSPNSIISSKQKIAASAQALGTAVSAMMVAAAELGLDGTNGPDVVSVLTPFATSLGSVAALA